VGEIWPASDGFISKGKMMCPELHPTPPMSSLLSRALQDTAEKPLLNSAHGLDAVGERCYLWTGLSENIKY
jgi:hypothetical protein